MPEARIGLLAVADAAADADAQGLGWLTDAERRRLQAITVSARRASFLAGHWQARKRAGQWLGLAPDRIEWAADAQGRPRLYLAGEALPLHVSLSHSGDWLALALAEVPVGIDLELPRRDRDWEALARFVCSPEELRALGDGDAAARVRLFHAFWTLKEARGKRSGEGLRPKAARNLTAAACASEHAEAMSWEFGGGSLAVALAPGMGLSVEGKALGEPAHWRYIDGGGPALAD
ncbi:MAG: 4'-phosphopantetheinyl transferase family protein [Thermomonas sp.]